MPSNKVTSITTKFLVHNLLLLLTELVFYIVERFTIVVNLLQKAILAPNAALSARHRLAGEELNQPDWM